ncbi:MAG: cytidylate kinase-like family protein [Clostridiales bacterium]|nr:cytidylate kinase-like family protein [Clostridiales bacterium]
MAVITISRQFGAGGEVLARLVASELGYRLVDRGAIVEALKEMGMSPNIIRLDEQAVKGEDLEKRRRFYLTALHEFLIDLADKESFVLVGRGGQFLFKDRPDAFNILVTAPFNQRVQWIKEIYGLGRKPASLLVREQDRRKKRYLRQVFGRTWQDVEIYDLVVNTKTLTPLGAANLAIQAARLFLENAKTAAGKAAKIEEKPKDQKKFMHPSEEEFARLLDFYNLRWEYEPRTFPLRWDSEGNMTEAFAPDFYLVDQDLYMELTTQRQKLVWKKNKKTRRLKELYPEVKIKIIYNKDYHNILESFGMSKE